MKKAMQVEGGLDTSIKLRMLINIALDFMVGLVPFVGDLADAAFKCNTKNLRLLEVTLDKKYKPRNLTTDERDLVGVDKERRRKNRQSGIYAPQDPPPATAFEDFSDEDEDRRRDADRQASGRVQEPRPTRAPEDRRGGGGGWFSRSKPGSRRDRNPEHEMRETRRQETGSVRR